MTGRFDDDIIEEIRERIDIVHLINEYVPLRRAGRNYKGVCPFHKEKTPSFFVNPELRIFKCFGCGESGNIFSFIMKYEGIPFYQAVERLARLAGIVLPERNATDQKNRSYREKLFALLNRAQEMYTKALLEDSMPAAQAREYLKQRGIGIPAIKRFKLGLAPDSWDFLLTGLQRGKFTVADMLAAGVVVRNEAGKIYDRLRNRIIFPIREHREGRIVAFGGRTLGDDPAKYINSPETKVYHKGKVLYGLRDAMRAMRRTRQVIVVEGYFDRISMALAGFENTVATCGTALTPEQVKLLRRSAEKVFLLFDSDVAGISAARRALELCLASGVQTLAVSVPQGKDPDDFLRGFGADAMRDVLDHAMPAMDFIIQTAHAKHDFNTPRGRRDAVQEMIPFLLSVDNSIDRGALISRIATLIGVPDTSVLELIKRHRHRKAEPQRKIEKIEIDPRERDFFILLIHAPEIMPTALETIPPENLLTEAGRSIYRILAAGYTESENLNISRVIDLVEHDAIRRLLVEWAMNPQKVNRIANTPIENLSALATDFSRAKLKQRLEVIKREIRSRQEQNRDVIELLNEQFRIVRELKG